MSNPAGNVIDFAPAVISPSTSWAPAGDALQPRAEAAPVAADWTGLERIEQVVARQRRYMVRDVAAAAAFAGLCIAVATALL